MNPYEGLSQYNFNFQLVDGGCLNIKKSFFEFEDVAIYLESLISNDNHSFSLVESDDYIHVVNMLRVNSISVTKVEEPCEKSTSLNVRTCRCMK